MAKLRGVNLELYNGSTKILGIREVDVTLEATEIDFSDHDSGAWVETGTGTWKWSAEVSGIYIDADTTQTAIFDLGISGAAATFSIRPNGTGTGKTKFDGSARVSKITPVTGPQDGAQAFNFSLRGAGALSRGVQ